MNTAECDGSGKLAVGFDPDELCWGCCNCREASPLAIEIALAIGRGRIFRDGAFSSKRVAWIVDFYLDADRMLELTKATKALP